MNVCPSAPGYTFYVGRDSPESNNLVVLQEKGGFIGDMLAACEARGEECQGFSTFGAIKSSTIRYAMCFDGRRSISSAEL